MRAHEGHKTRGTCDRPYWYSHSCSASPSSIYPQVVAHREPCTYCGIHSELLWEGRPICVACMCKIESGQKLFPKPKPVKRCAVSEYREPVQVDLSTRQYENVASFRRSHPVN